jgi:hypothetical protein
LLFGYNDEKNKFLDYFNSLDTSNEIEWKKIILKTRIPLMSSCANISFSMHQVYIFGGIDNKNQKNNTVYRYNAQDNFFEQTELCLKSNFDFQEQNPNLPQGNLPSLNFVEESSFRAFNFDPMYIDYAFNFGCFDSKNYFHLINLKSFSHNLFYLNVNDTEESFDRENSNEIKNDSFISASLKVKQMTNSSELEKENISKYSLKNEVEEDKSDIFLKLNYNIDNIEEEKTNKKEK